MGLDQPDLPPAGAASLRHSKFCRGQNRFDALGLCHNEHRVVPRD